MEVKKIVLTGGPCAGKTTALSRISAYFEHLGWKVFIIPETATEVILSGVSPTTLDSDLDFEELISRRQITKEEELQNLVLTHLSGVEKVLIVCDRGLQDAYAYLSEEKQAILKNRLGRPGIETAASYDAVIHLVTAASGAEEAYTLANNPARQESSLEAARAADRRTLAAWMGFGHLRVIDNSTDFEGKMHRALTEITNLIGEPAPLEIERKFLIRTPDLQALRVKPNVREVTILQFYLKSGADSEARIRMRSESGQTIFTKTVKRHTSIPSLRYETEERISEHEFSSELLNADYSLSPILKTRYLYLLPENPGYLEIDVYPDSLGYALLEVELPTPEAKFTLPPDFEILGEVTDDPRFYNHEIAKNGGFPRPICRSN